MFLVEASRETEVCELDMSTTIEKYVIWFDVPEIKLAHTGSSTSAKKSMEHRVRSVLKSSITRRRMFVVHGNTN